MPCEFRVLVIKGQAVCEVCGEKLPTFILTPGLMDVFFQGMISAVAYDLGVGANPYWGSKHCYAIATWNAGWQHANECGNKKEVYDGC